MIVMESHNKFARHGDRNIRRLDTLGLSNIPNDLKPSKHNIVGIGESTHRHRINGQALVFDLEKPREITHNGRIYLVDQFLQVQEPCTITHEEHGEIPQVPGKYAILPEREVDILEQKIRSVAD